MTRDPEWLDAREAEFINHQLVSMFGGQAGGVRDRDLLQAAIGRPLSQWAYGNPTPDLFDLAAAYCFALCKGHVFHDGNKRTAHAVATVFLHKNGYRHDPPAVDVVASMVALASDRLSEDGIATWFRRTSNADRGRK